MWYHLNGGRYLFEHHAIAHDSFFSFLSPPRAWVNYYWLFQGLLFSLYTWSGYYGLIALRACMYLATTMLVLRYLLNELTDQEWFSWSTFLAVLYLIILIPRHIAVRPHIMSYWFILCFLFILEYRPTRVWILPMLAIGWYNLHGIEYPVMLLLLGAYGLEALLARWKREGASPRSSWGFLGWLALAGATVLLPPHGVQILPLPFKPLGYLSQFIVELSSVTLDGVLSAHLSTFTAPSSTTFNLFLLCSGLVVMTAVVKRRARLGHLLLWGGGLVLLTMGYRFTYEYALLALPLMKANPLCRPRLLGQQLPRPALLSLVVMLIVTSFLSVKAHFESRPTYPFSSQGLPEGVVAFLNRVGTGGTVLNQPNNGGYLQWMLYPRYRIFMDMEVGPLFPPEDFLHAQEIFSHPAVLAQFLDQYHPVFITLPLDERKASELLKDVPEYAIVFFDDAEVLYVNRRLLPDLAVRYELKGVDPFELHKRPADSFGSAPAQEPVLAYLSQMLAIDPNCGTTNYLAGALYNQLGVYDRTLLHAERIVRNFPNRSVGYELRGDALRGLALYDAAADAYRAALWTGAGNTDLYMKLGALYLKQRRYAAAYRALERGIDVFSMGTTSEDLYRLGLAACLAGRRQDAKVIGRYLSYRIAPNDPTWVEKLEREWAAVGVLSS